MVRIAAARAGVRFNRHSGPKPLAGSWAPNGGYSAPALTYLGTWGTSGTGSVTSGIVPGQADVSIQFNGLAYVAGNNGTLSYTSGSNFDATPHARGIIVMNAAGSVVYGTFTPNDTQA